MRVFAIVCIIVGVVVFLLDLYFVLVSIGFRKRYCSQCKGYLKQTVQHKNKYVGLANGQFYRHYLDFTYTYRVNGIVYQITDGIPGTKIKLNTVGDVVYQIRNPKYSYIKRLTTPTHPVISVILCPIWILFLVGGVMLLR